MRSVLIVLLVALATVCAHQLQAQESKSSESSASATSSLSLLRLRARRGNSSPPSPTLLRSNSQHGKPPKSSVDAQVPSQQKPNKLKSSSQSQKRKDLTSSNDSHYSDFSDEPEEEHADPKNIYVCFDLDETLTIKRTTAASMPTIFGKDSDSTTARIRMLDSYLDQLKHLSPRVRLYVLTFNGDALAQQALTEYDKTLTYDKTLAGRFDRIVAWNTWNDGLINIFKDKLHSVDAMRPRIKATYMEEMAAKFHADKNRMILIDDDPKNTNAAREMGFKVMTVPKDPQAPGIQEGQLKELVTMVQQLVTSGSF